MYGSAVSEMTHDWGKFFSVAAAASGLAGLYWESTPILALSVVCAITGVVGWVRWTSPHDHWGGLPKRNPWDP